MVVDLSYGIDPKQLFGYVVVPANLKLGMSTLAADQLVLGTAMCESELRWLDQIDRDDKPGPAYGLWQMEQATHDDIWDNWLRYQYHVRPILLGVVGHSPRAMDLRTNLLYAAMMCRVHYRRMRGMPIENDARNLATYWKQFYNTPLGKGTVEKALPHFQRAIEISR